MLLVNHSIEHTQSSTSLKWQQLYSINTLIPIPSKNGRLMLVTKSCKWNKKVKSVTNITFGEFRRQYLLRSLKSSLKLKISVNFHIQYENFYKNFRTLKLIHLVRMFQARCHFLIRSLLDKCLIFSSFF